jgi:hypothetical protein
MRTVLNRVLLALLGLAALLLGGLVLIGGFDLDKRLNWLKLPSRWPWSRPDDVLLTVADRTRWEGESWWWPVCIGALAVLVLLTLWWFLAQLRQRPLRRVAVAEDPATAPAGDAVGGGVQLRGRALAEAVAAEARALPEVDDADAMLTGRPTRPRLNLVLNLSPEADPQQVLDTLHRRTLPNARASAGLTELTAQIRLRGPGPTRGRHLD